MVMVIYFGAKSIIAGAKYSVQVCGNKEFLENVFQKYYPSECSLYKDKYSKQCYTWKITSS